VVSENERVEHGATLLADGDLEAFGQLMDASHASLAEDYEVSCAELDALVEIAQSVEGVLGTRMTGAGFGGCTVTLARRGWAPAVRLADALSRALRPRSRNLPHRAQL
jgi:galactokinase